LAVSAPEQQSSAELSEPEDMFADEEASPPPPPRAVEDGSRSQSEAGESQQSLSSLPLSVLDIKVSTGTVAIDMPCRDRCRGKIFCYFLSSVYEKCTIVSTKSFGLFCFGFYAQMIF
jgi:hypothetical protein